MLCKRLIGEVVQSRRRPLLGPSPGWKSLLALSHLRHYAKLFISPVSTALRSIGLPKKPNWQKTTRIIEQTFSEFLWIFPMYSMILLRFRSACKAQRGDLRMLPGTLPRYHLHYQNQKKDFILLFQPHRALSSHLFNGCSRLHSSTGFRGEVVTRYNNNNNPDSITMKWSVVLMWRM